MLGTRQPPVQKQKRGAGIKFIVYHRRTHLALNYIVPNSTTTQPYSWRARSTSAYVVLALFIYVPAGGWVWRDGKTHAKIHVRRCRYKIYTSKIYTFWRRHDHRENENSQIQRGPQRPTRKICREPQKIYEQFHQDNSWYLVPRANKYYVQSTSSCVLFSKVFWWFLGAFWSFFSAVASIMLRDASACIVMMIAPIRPCVMFECGRMYVLASYDTASCNLCVMRCTDYYSVYGCYFFYIAAAHRLQHVPPTSVITGFFMKET